MMRATVEQVDELADLVGPPIGSQGIAMRERIPAGHRVELTLRFLATSIFMLYLFLRALLQTIKYLVRVTTSWHGNFAWGTASRTRLSQRLARLCTSASKIDT